MKLLRIFVALVVIMYTSEATTEYQPINIGSTLPEFIGAPCSTQTDIDECTCILTVNTPKKWKRKK